MEIQKRDIKVLISADAHGRLEQLIPKVAQLQAKNNFDFMLMLGQVCHTRASNYIKMIKQQQAKLPLPIYFIDNSLFAPILYCLHPTGAEIVQDFNFLGKKGVTQINGLNIAFYSTNEDWKEGQPSGEDVEQFIKLCQNKRIDILLTNQWPTQVQRIIQGSKAKCASYVSKLADALSPRYHFAAGSECFHRLPVYRNKKMQQTNFISVAPCGQQLKDKYLFAIVVKSNHIQLADYTGNFLQNPYLKTSNSQVQIQAQVKRKMIDFKNKKSEQQGEIIVYFQGFPQWARQEDIVEFLERWGETKHFQSFKDKKGGRSGTVRFADLKSTKNCLADTGKFLFHSNRIKFQSRSVRQRQRVEQCWFCKANSDKSLVAWWGRFLYISLEKGPLHRFHVQLIPYNHTQSSGRLDREEKQQLDKVLGALRRHFSDNGYQIITYQRCLPLSQAVNHSVIHFIPIKSVQSLCRKFETLNKEDSLYFKQWKGDRRNNQYYLQLKINQNTYIRQVRRKQKVQADIMRQILCQLFQTPQLVSWKACERTPQKLSQQLSAFQKQIQQAGLPVQMES